MSIGRKILYGVLVGAGAGLVLGLTATWIRQQQYGVVGGIVGGACAGLVAGLLIAIARRSSSATASR